MRNPDEIIDVKKKNCGKCHVELKEPFGFIARRIIVIPEVKSRLIEFRLADYGLCRCGARNIATHPQCPTEGNASASTLAFVQELRIAQRLSIGLTVRFLKERVGA